MNIVPIRLLDVSDPLFQARFWNQVESKGLCWEWQGAKSARGYGIALVNGESIRAHRISYVMAYGSISEDKLACHTCDNPCCVNPLHLYEGTDQDNVFDCISRSRRGRGYFRKDGKSQKSLSDTQVETIRMRYSERSVTLLGLAKEYELGRTTIQHIVWGETYRDAPGPISARRWTHGG